MRTGAVIAMILGLALAEFDQKPAYSGDFRVVSRVFEADDEQPISRNLTLFRGGVVYDFVESGPREVTIFDAQRGRLVLLSPARKVKAEVATRELADFVAAARDRARGARDGLLRFLAEPQFEIVDADSEPRVALKSRWLTYDVTCEACEANAAKQYREFADWYAQLNLLTRPQSLPSFARLELNSVLAGRGQVPREIRLEIHGLPLTGGKQQMRSEHEFNWKLAAADARTIDSVGAQLVAFDSVSLEEYQHNPAVAMK